MAMGGFSDSDALKSCHPLGACMLKDCPPPVKVLALKFLPPSLESSATLDTINNEHSLTIYHVQNTISVSFDQHVSLPDTGRL